ncbi:hypothetical protein EDD22DRAFT_955119 [Suillus occidentalis]|nr:hypothetical protein EDD22DRAFT_955119 [Suillus occidentalis]
MVDPTPSIDADTELVQTQDNQRNPAPRRIQCKKTESLHTQTGYSNWQRIKQHSKLEMRKIERQRERRVKTRLKTKEQEKEKEEERQKEDDDEGEDEEEGEKEEAEEDGMEERSEENNTIEKKGQTTE